MQISPEPMRKRGGKTSKRQREYLPNPAMYVSAPPLVEPKESSKPKRKKITLSRHFVENLIAGLGFAGGVFIFAALALYLFAGRF